MHRRLPSLVVLCFALALVAGACSRTTTITESSRPGPVPTAPGGGSASATDAAAVDDPTDSVESADASPDSTDEPDSTDGSDEPDDEAAEADPTDGLLGVGGSEQIDALRNDCEAGSEMACDILFQASGLDSPEELIARTCGGRRPDNVGFCTDAILPDGPNLWFDEDSPGLPAVVGACEVGFMTACDFLYFRSAVGSAYEEIGNTCAGRVEIAIPDCRTAFPDE